MERRDEGFVLVADYDPTSDAYSIYMIDSEGQMRMASNAPPDKATSIVMSRIGVMAEGARQKSESFPKPPKFVEIDREFPGVKIMAFWPNIVVHQVNFRGIESTFAVLMPNNPPLIAEGEKDLISKCAHLISFDNLYTAHPLVGDGEKIHSYEVRPGLCTTVVKPSKTRIFDGEWIAALIVYPGKANIVGWAKDTTYSWLLHDCVAFAARKQIQWDCNESDSPGEEEETE